MQRPLLPLLLVHTRVRTRVPAPHPLQLLELAERITADAEKMRFILYELIHVVWLKYSATAAGQFPLLPPTFFNNSRFTYRVCLFKRGFPTMLGLMVTTKKC